ncbi:MULTISPECIES: VOC family protein [Chitinophaga]|nr:MULTISPECIES: VOC family protein [Chitinophaga]
MVDDIDNLVLKLPAGNIVTMPASTQWGYAAVIQDPDGRKIELVQA